MKAIPLEFLKRFEKYLLKNDIPEKFKGEYKKWLQYYLDLCRKYKLSPEYQESLPPFILKVAEKR